jgi:hypothetical protein
MEQRLMKRQGCLLWWMKVSLIIGLMASRVASRMKPSCCFS